jgi:hypothetical protein
MMAMTWIYSQRLGVLSHDTEEVGNGYAGKELDCNNPWSETKVGYGPIPRGLYKIGSSYKHPKLGSFTMNVTPVGHNAHGRTAFRIHGDSRLRPGAASEGCIILPLAIRQMISESNDKELFVGY